MFDGHSGVDAADFSAANLICNIVRHKQFPTDIESAMKDGFIQTDTDFCTKAVVEVCGVWCVLLVLTRCMGWWVRAYVQV